MKASEIVKAIESLIEEHGDMDIYTLSHHEGMLCSSDTSGIISDKEDGLFYILEGPDGNDCIDNECIVCHG